MIGAPVALSTPRLTLEVLRVEHADELAGVLSDPALYDFTGGTPPTVDELRTRYARQVVGRSADGAQLWFNWVLRVRETGAAVGTVQATVSGQVAEVAWVVGVEHQRQGYAHEAANAMVAWLRDNGCDVLVAHIRPDHRGSVAVARALGLQPTSVVVDGEVRWESAG